MSSRSTRRIAAAVLAAGAALGAIALPASAQGDPYRSHVVISNVQYDSPGSDDRSNRSLNKEWVDVTNTSGRAVNLDGWTLSAEDGHTYTFRHYRLEDRSTVRVHTGDGRDSNRDLYQDLRFYVWDNYSDTATLRNDRDRFVDAVSWGGRHDGDRDGDHRGGRDGREDGGRHHGDRDGDRRGDRGDRGGRGSGGEGGRHHGGRHDNDRGADHRGDRGGRDGGERGGRHGDRH
ncbi:lamin tail domain-containing protein [Streptomyces avermitilis]|uniref:lamin tail domain-containing protein n=1 Tax=Streptomyces avermitilis TaxID=33903 RepID=UPI003F4D2D77